MCNLTGNIRTAIWFIKGGAYGTALTVMEAYVYHAVIKRNIPL